MIDTQGPESSIHEQALVLLDGMELPSEVREAAAEALPPAAPSIGSGSQLRDIYLQRLSVAGFRGIGTRTDLELDPRPGLTVVVGRNGSGKSSLAEAFELMLTDRNHRWLNRPKVWRDGWRNMHSGTDARVEATFALAGSRDTVVVRRTWTDDAKAVEEADVRVLGIDGDDTTLDALGWSEPLRQMRPFLPYSELGSMFDELKTIYDSLAPILGLDELEEAIRQLRERRLDAEKAERALRTRRRSLADRAAACPDGRGPELAALLRARALDAGALDALIGRDGPDDDVAAARRRLSLADVPEREAVHALLDAHAAAVQEMQSLALTSSARDREIADLIAAAIRYRTDRLDERCPVCETDGVLDEAWLARADERVASLRHHATELDAADQAVRRAAADVLAAIAPLSALVDLADRCGADSTDIAAALVRWEQAWAQAGAHAERVEFLETVLRSARALRDAARARQEQDDAEWRPLAHDATAWLADHRRQQAGTPAAVLKRAEKALVEVDAAMRAERMAPIADGARRTWESLRQQSNVSFHDIALKRVGNNRTANIDVRVDGSEASALSVLSQGELNALALSVFLPRATLDDSPFRFAVIDDPVQAMDPAKVDGLAQVLHQHGATRQVVVFTHDTRLPEALVRLSLDARIIEVQRDLRSVVRLRPGRDLIRRCCDDALAVARDESLDWAVRSRVSLALCRSAIEAGAERGVWRRRLQAGIAHQSVEEELARCTTTNSKVAAVFATHSDDRPNVLACVRDTFGQTSVEVLKGTTSAAHGRIAEGIELIPTIKGALRLANGLGELPQR